jgi:hypothetical protein
VAAEPQRRIQTNQVLRMQESKYNKNIAFSARAAEADPSDVGQPNSSTVESQRSEAAEETRRKPIISINGRDVDEDEMDRVA